MLPPSSAREMLMQVKRYANGGEASAESSVGLARALASGTPQEQYYQNIRDYVAKTANPLAALNTASEYGVSMADINRALGTQAATDYFTTDYNTETAPSTNVATGFTSEAAQRYNAPGGLGQARLDAEIKKVSDLYAANTPENAQILRDMFIKEGGSIADLQRAGFDPSRLLGTVAKKPTTTPPPAPPVYTPPVVTPETQIQYPQPTQYTAPTVYQPLPVPPPIYGAGQPALDVNFRNSAPRSAYDPRYGYMYSPAARLLPATGAGMSFTPPSVTSRPRSLLNVPLPVSQTPKKKWSEFTPEEKASFGLSASQVFAREQSEKSSTSPNRFAGQTAPTTPAVDYTTNPNAIEPIEFRFFQKGGPVKKPEGSAQEELTRFANGGMPEAGRKPLAATDPLYIQTDAPAPRNPDAVARPIPKAATPAPAPAAAVARPTPKAATPAATVARPTPMSQADLIAQIDRSTASTPSAVTPERDPVKTESAGMLARLNQAFYENVSKPAVGTLIDMTVGLGDLAQMGTKYVANRAGIETKPFTPVAPRIQEAAGTAGYDPYTLGGVAASILPFARGQQAASSLRSAFPNIGRETAAYGGGEAGAAAARAALPDSTAAELFGSFVGGTAGSIAGAPRTQIDGPRIPGEEADELTGLNDPVDELAALDETPAQPGTAAQMLDDVVDAADVSPGRLFRPETQAIDKVVKSRGRRRALKTEARRIKSNYLQENGWAPIEVVGVKKGKPNFKEIAYGFEKPPEGLDRAAWSNRLSDNIVSEVDGVVARARAGDQAALAILRQANWYRSMRDQLRSEFGGIGDVFADVLGTTSAQTNVEQNFKNATEILRRYSRGEFDAELQAYENRIKQGLPVDGKTLTALHNAGEFPLITSSSGKLFNTNSPSSMGALLDMFRSVKQGSSPKTPNFTGNLIGLTTEATIDVWAARFLRRLSGRSRIPPAAESTVTGKHKVNSTLENPLVGGEFGFGQEVFRNAASRVNAAGGVKSVIPEMGDLGPDDLQAIAWFMEKERWTDKGWTTKAGEGGSLEYEMSLAGSPEQVKINDLRREINTGFKAPNKRKKETDAEYAERVAQARRVYDNRQAFASIELQALQAPLQRYTIGISGERPGLPMSNYAQAELAAEVDDVVRNNPAVLGYNFANTYGSFMGNTERALNAELVVQQDFDPSALTRRVVEQGKFYDQDAVFISKSVPAGAPNARPGVEIFYKKAVSPADLDKITASLRAYGIDGFTYITDMRFNDKINRQTRSGDPETATLTGLRFQYIPEFDDAFDPTRAAEIYKEKEDLFEAVLNDTMLDQNVSDIRFNFYDTQVFFRDGYDEYLTRNTSASGNQAGRELPSGASLTQSDNGGRAGTELRQPVPDGLNQAPNGSGTQEGIASGGDFALGGYVTKKANGGDVFPVKSNASSSRRMLDDLIGKKPEGQRVDATGLQRFANGGDASPMSQADLLAQIDRSTAATPSAVTPDRDPVKTESAGMLSRLNAAFGRNISQPIVGSAIDMTAGLGDFAQWGTKFLANRAGFETQPFTPVSPRIQEAAGTAGYDPYSPAALAATVLLPAAGPLRTAAAATRPMMSMAAPGSARETLSLVKPILDREASVAASAELAAMGARELAPDNATAEITAALAGGAGYNVLENIMGGVSRGPTTSGIIKEGGGNWIGEGIDDEMGELRAKNQGSLSKKPAALLEEMYSNYTPEAIARLSPESARSVTASIDLLKGKASIDKWIDTKLSKYIRNEMATEGDPIRALAERGVLHVNPVDVGINRYAAPLERKMAGYPEGGLGQSYSAKAWEDASDVSITSNEAQDFIIPRDSEYLSPAALSRINTDFMEKNPWLLKLAPKTNVYDLPQQAGYGTRLIQGLGFDHLIDELNNATRPNTDLPERLRIDYNKLDRMSVPQIVEKVANINSWRVDNMSKANQALANNAATHFDLQLGLGTKTYPETGLRWAQLRMPDGETDPTTLQAALKYEGDTMGHCVGGYCDDVAANSTQIFSLRDAKGAPHVTIETEVDKFLSGDRLNAAEPGLFDLYKESLDFAPDGSMHEWLQKNRPEIFERLLNTPSIVQIKGKGNAAPAEKYLPAVQDFVKSRSWSDVGDLRNTGLIKIDIDSDLAKSLTQKGIAVPTYATQQEITNLLKQAQVGAYHDWQRSGTLIRAEPPTEELAVGGSVLAYAQGGYVTRKQDGGTVSAPMSNAELLAQIDRSTANSPAPAYGTASSAPRDPVQTDSRNMLERFTSLNTPQNMSIPEIAADIGMGFVPVVGTAQGARDFERARRDSDKLGMVLSAASMIPVVGGAVKAARTVGKASKAADDLAALTAKAPTEATPNLTRFLANSQVKEPVFHAAKADVKEFSPKYRTELSSMGFHFGTADQANFRTGQYDFDSKSPNIGKYYLNIENPLEVSHMASFAPDHLAEKMMDMDLLTEDAYDVLSAKNDYDAIATGDSLVKILKKNGYDGLKYKNEREGEGFSFVPFNPTQIKSAIGNEGTFDPANPVITKAQGGYITKKTKGA